MKNVVTTDRGPKPIGPYSQAIKANGFVYVSGQVALDPKTGEMMAGDIAQQTERALENLKAIVEASGTLATLGGYKVLFVSGFKK